MPSELFPLVLGIILALLLAGLLALAWSLNRTLTDLGGALRGLRDDAGPVFKDLRSASRDLALAAEGLRGGVQKAGSLADAIGAIGDDLEGGRRVVHGALGLVADLVGPWLGKRRPKQG